MNIIKKSSNFPRRIEFLGLSCAFIILVLGNLLGEANAQKETGGFQNAVVQSPFAKYVSSIKEKAFAGDSDALGVYSSLVLDFGNQVEAINLAQKSAANASCFGQYILGKKYQKGYIVEKSQKRADAFFEQSIPKLIQLAESGNAVAQSWIGEAYMSGFGLPRNPEKSLEWSLKAAAQGDVDAQCRLCLSYEFGMGVDRDPEKFKEWSRKVAEQGIVEWYIKAAEQGFSGAQVSLGLFYETGIGTEKNHQEAIEWIKKAVKNGNEDAKSVLETMVTEDKVKQKVSLNVADDGSEKYGGPSTEIVLKMLDYPSIKMLLGEDVKLKIKRGKILTAGGGPKIPGGTTIFPIRVNCGLGDVTYYFYKDPFDDWSLEKQD